MMGDCGQHCDKCVVVWQEGKRFIRHCGELSSLEEYLYKNIEAMKKQLDQIERNTNVSGLTP